MEDFEGEQDTLLLLPLSSSSTNDDHMVNIERESGREGRVNEHMREENRKTGMERKVWVPSGFVLCISLPSLVFNQIQRRKMSTKGGKKKTEEEITLPKICLEPSRKKREK